MKGIRGAAAAVALLMAGAALAPALDRAPAQTVAPPPNIIVIMSDDQGRGMMRALPTVTRQLGDRGATFTNAFASYPLCCPARATLLTGQYAHNHGVKGNTPRSGGGNRALLSPERNLAAWLQAAGYETAFAGKWLNGLRTPRRPPPGWNQWWGLVGAGGESLSSFYDYDVFEPDGSPRHFGDRSSDYQTDALTREYVLPYLDAQLADPRPFFLWLAYHPPHNGVGRDDPAGRRCSEGPPDSRRGSQSAIPPPRYARRFNTATVPRPPSFDEGDVSEKPKFVSRRPPLSDADLERIERDYRCGLAAMLALDDAVGAIVDRLSFTGQIGSTVLVFLPDQGVMAGEHRIKRGKNRPYEEAIRVPLLIRGPSIAPGAEIDAPVVNADLAPTLLELAGASVPPELERPIDGTSLAPVLRGGPPDADRAVLIEGRSNVARSKRGFKVRSYVGVRSARYAYFEYRRSSHETQGAGMAAPIGAGRTTARELYDLGRDPYQLRNLAADRAYAEPRRRLSELLAELERCSGAECVLDAGVTGPSGRRSGRR